MPTLLHPDTPEKQKTPTTYIEYTAKGQTPKWKDFKNHGGTTRRDAQVIFLDGYKGIRNEPASADANFEIYEITKDPSESTDLRTSSADFEELNQRMKDRVLQIRQPDSSASRPWDNAPVPPPTKLPALKSGIAYQSYTGLWPWIPNFDDLTPVATGKLENGIDLSVLPTSAPESGLLFTGYLQIPTTGLWDFELQSDSGAFLRIHDVMVVDDDFNHDGSPATGKLLLEKGLHPFRIYYKNSKPTQPSLNLKWRGPNHELEEIPASALFTASEE